MVIDAHTHIYRKIKGFCKDGSVVGLSFGKAKQGEHVISVLPPLNKHVEHTPEMLVATMDETGVEKAVLLQGPFYGECNNYVAMAVPKYRERFVGMAYIDLWIKGFCDIFGQIIRRNIFRGFKIEFSEPTGLFGIHCGISLLDESIAWLCTEMERKGLTLTLDLGAPGTGSYQTGAVRKLALEHPNLKIVICHLGQPGSLLDNKLSDLWKDQILLGLLPNVWFDTASIPAYFSNERYPFTEGMKYFKYGIDMIGAGKIMWGTDTPGLLLHAAYGQLIQLGDIFTGDLTSDDKKEVLYDNALKVYFDYPGIKSI